MKYTSFKGAEGYVIVVAPKKTRRIVMAKKFRWGILGGAFCILVFYLTAGFIVAWMILDRIAAQTSYSASPFGTWWQMLIFVLDLVFALCAAGCFVAMAITRKKMMTGESADEKI